jgi:hypothetical protein
MGKQVIGASSCSSRGHARSLIISAHNRLLPFGIAVDVKCGDRR